MVFVYVIRSINKNYRYVGITRDIKKRLAQHIVKKSFYSPFKLVLSESYESYSDARKREIFLKSGQGRVYLDTLT